MVELPEVAAILVRDVLGLKALESSVVLAGHDGLEREVTGVNVVELPEVRRWLRGGEFLLTAGYAWREEPERLAELIRGLYETGAVALGLKLGMYISRVPDRVLDVADQLAFPLVRIPKAVAYMDIMEPVFQQINARRLSLLERTFDAASILTSLALNDQSIDGLIDALADQVQGTVIVFDGTTGSVASSEPGTPMRTRPLETLDPEISATLTAPTPAPAIPHRPVIEELSAGRVVRVPLVFGHQPHGQILLVEHEVRFGEFAQRALVHVADIISFLLMKRAAGIQGRREAARLFLDSLMEASLTGEEASERAKSLGLRLSAPHFVAIVGFGRNRSCGAVEALSGLADRAFSSAVHVVGWTPGDDRFLALVEAAGDTADSILETGVDFLIARARDHSPDVPLIAAGSVLSGLDGVRRSRSEATIAYQTACHTGRTGLVRFGQLGVDRFLAQIPDPELGRQYLRGVLGPLEEDLDLLRTLETYLEHRGNKVRAAAAIPLHRSSLMYRLDKISNLLGVDLDDPERYLELWLALRLRRILGPDRTDAG